MQWRWLFAIDSLWWFVECVFTILFPCTVSGMFDIAALKMFRYFWTGICIQCLSVILYSLIWTRKGRLALQSYLLEEKGLWHWNSGGSLHFERVVKDNKTKFSLWKLSFPQLEEKRIMKYYILWIYNISLF